MIISSLELENTFRTRWRAIQIPRIPPANAIYIPSMEFFKNEWMNFWTEYKKSRNLTYFNQGMCEQFSKTAVVEFNWLTLLKAKQDGLGDVMSSLVEVRLLIPSGVILNQIKGQSYHSTCAVTLRDEKGKYETYFWEPQNNEFEVTYVDLAINHNIGVYDLIF